MNHKHARMDIQKKIALVAHDHKKDDLPAIKPIINANTI